MNLPVAAEQPQAVGQPTKAAARTRSASPWPGAARISSERRYSALPARTHPGWLARRHRDEQARPRSVIAPPRLQHGERLPTGLLVTALALEADDLGDDADPIQGVGVDEVLAEEEDEATGQLVAKDAFRFIRDDAVFVTL